MEIHIRNFKMPKIKNTIREIMSVIDGCISRHHYGMERISELEVKKIKTS
jgi:hypothetical protein